jgi:hypothetical protein
MAKIKVLGKTWVVIVRSEKWLQKNYPDCHAIALLDERKVLVRKTSLNVEVITHELIHCYAHTLSFIEMELDDDQLEEAFCELFAKYGEQIIKDAKSLCATLSD